MAEAYVGEIRLLAFNYAPEGWLLCQGQQLNVSQYQALFALIGNVYGGDGDTTFNLPDLRGRVPTQCGQGPLSVYQWAQKGGTTATTINASSSFTLSSVNQLPAHSHSATFTPTGGGTPVQPTIAVKVSNDAGTSSTPIANGYIAKSASTAPAQPTMYASTASSTTTLNSDTATASGGSGGITGGSVGIGTTGSVQPSPVNVPISVSMPAVMPPFVAMNYAICVNGYFPPRP
ncbi:phage tail protein [Noviherbaspirillum malthae]|jgi:microcystin-dependent protein|uniref:phage tail protein n=1 Tax=Noviherbaspirillum malthae TaxID=1260987 RepID=UPI00188EFC7F|nr:tail fiber protein [Noviherbaspirillum malthae]